MPRKPEPWYWARRKGWYVQVDGRQIKLGDDPAPKPKRSPQPPDGVMREYYRVMATSGRTTYEDRQKATVAEVCEVYLASKAGLRPGPARQYSFHLGRFAFPLAGRLFSSVRKGDVVRIAESQSRWSPGTRHDFVKKVLAVYRWARDAGYIDFNPFAGWDNPYQESARPRGITEGEFAAILDDSSDLAFKRVLMFLRGTGCRVGELCAVEAKHVSPDRPLVTLPPELHKTGGATGRSRVLVLGKDVEVMVRVLVSRHPTGPLLRNRSGGRWTPQAIEARFRRGRRRLKLDDSLSPHMVRHSTLTRMLDAGTALHLVAKIAGHANANTLQSVYYHPDVDLMVAAADKAHMVKKG